MYKDIDRWVLAGIVSFGTSIACAQPYQPGVYHYIPESIDWIRETMDMPTPKRNASCPTHWSKFEDKCYYVHPAAVDRVSWHVAQAYCNGRGGALASLHTAAENEFVYDLAATKLFAFATNRDNDWWGVWLGGIDNSSSSICSASKDCNYKWSDGTSWDYTHWAADEPSASVYEYEYYPNEEEKCLGMVLSGMSVQLDSKWNDYVCTPRRKPNNVVGFVCAVDDLSDAPD